MSSSGDSVIVGAVVSTKAVWSCVLWRLRWGLLCVAVVVVVTVVSSSVVLCVVAIAVGTAICSSGDCGACRESATRRVHV